MFTFVNFTFVFYFKYENKLCNLEQIFKYMNKTYKITAQLKNNNVRNLQFNQ